MTTSASALLATHFTTTAVSRRRLEAGGAYSILVGDRVDSVSSYGESELFEIVLLPVSGGQDDNGSGGSTADGTAAAAGDDSDDPGQLVLGIVIGLVAGGPSPLPPPHFFGGVSHLVYSEAFCDL